LGLREQANVGPEMDKPVGGSILLPEALIGGFLGLLIVVLMWGSQTPACHRWKHQLNTVSAAYVTTNAGAIPSTEIASRRAELRAATGRVLEERPFACL
jgi:hypothetical protein